MDERSVNAFASARRGCITCRSKKVKCDRQSPKCSRCIRLQLECSWPSAKSLKERRRGQGTLRAREGTGWSPPQILPSRPQNSDASTLISNVDHPGQYGEFSSSHDGSVRTVGHTRQAATNFTDSIEAQYPENLLLHTAPDAVDRSVSDSSSWSSTSNGISFEFPRITTPLYNTLSNYEFALPNSLVLTGGEHSVLAEYQRGFLLVRATKKMKWCFHNILLRLGSQNPMVMHLLLAAALQEMSHLRPDDFSLEQAAQANFHNGALLLAKSANCVGFEAHLGFMTALYFVYLYMSTHRRSNHQRTKELSKAVRDHVKKYKLLNFDGDLYPSYSSQGLERDRSLMAYLIMNLLDEDVFCGLQDCGGELSNYLVLEHNMGDIFLTSKTVLQNYWDQEYPRSEITDDIENHLILEMRFKLNMLLHKINQFSQITDAQEATYKGMDVEHDMAEMERRYASLFRVVATPGDLDSRLTHGANMLVGSFNALRIYFFRCQVGNSEIETPTKIQAAIQIVLATVHRALKAALASMYPRYQWALFMAGIECKDPMHRNWLVSRLTNTRIKMTLERIISIQEHVLLGRMSIAAVREEFARERS